MQYNYIWVHWPCKLEAAKQKDYNLINFVIDNLKGKLVKIEKEKLTVMYETKCRPPSVSEMSIDLLLFIEEIQVNNTVAQNAMMYPGL